MIFIKELFGPTIQGEGPHAGMKTNFVRFGGCDFKCDWCDSKWTWITSPDDAISIEKLTEKLVNFCFSNHTSNIVLTGGNPCIYDLKSIIKELHKNNITVDIETQGSILPDWLLDLDLIVFSPKPPSSKMPDVYNKLSNWISEHDSTPNICIKIPIFNSDDIQFALKYASLVEELRNKNKPIELYLSVGNSDTAEEGDISYRILQKYEELITLINNYDFKRVFILPQLHTLIWGNKQGV